MKRPEAVSNRQHIKPRQCHGQTFAKAKDGRKQDIASLAKGLVFKPGASALLVWGVLAAQEPALALDSARPALSAHVPVEAKLATPLGRLPGERRLNLAIGLPLRHPEALTNLLRQLYDPSRPGYRHYLTSEQFTAEFGPTEQDYQAVMTFVRANGLSVIAVHPNRVVLDASGTVADIERTFHLSLRTYRHPVEDRAFYAPDAEPTLELAVPVLHISGLSDLVRPHPASLKVRPVEPGDGGTPAGGAGPNGTYLGKDFRGVYARNVQLTGTGQMLGLVEFDGYYTNDIARYCAQGSLTPQVPLINVLLDDFDGQPTGSANEEVALDIEMANSMAPGLAAIIVYEAGPSGYPEDVLNRMATDNLAKQLSTSWGFADTSTISQIFQQFAAQGQSFFTASGDSGAATGSVYQPSDDPYITSVGGTTLTTTGPGGRWVSETAWNWFSSGVGTSGTGGGVSPTYKIPSWQQGVPSLSTNGGSTTMRNFPDVAMVADAIYIYADNGSSLEVGGTSASAPLWAGFTALINQQAVGLGQSPVGFINPAVYAIGTGPGYAANFHDITTGNNTNRTSPTEFYAGPSYDLCTGWGTPTGQSLIDTLAPRPNAPFITNAGTSLFAEGCSPPNGVIDPGETVTVNFSLKNLGAVSTTNLVATLQADSGVLAPSGPQTYGALPGNSPAYTHDFTFTANGACGATLIATLQLQDGPLNLGAVPFTFTLGKPVTPLSEGFDGVTARALPAGWTSTTSGGGVPWVTSTALRDNRPNAAFAAEPTNSGLTELLSPIIPVATASAQMTFRNNFNTETDPADWSTAYDGGVLEIRIGAGQFMDILAAGGAFVSGGYNRTIASTNTDNPLAGRAVWGGLSGGFITTTVNLPAAAAGQSVQFKWRFGTDIGNYYGGLGWYIDTVSVQDGIQCCDSATDLAISLSPVQSLAGLGQVFAYSIMVTNSGFQAANNVIVTDFLPTNVVFSSASAGGQFTNSAVTWNLGALSAGSSANLSLAVIPANLDAIKNTVTVASITLDPVPGNNTTTASATVLLPPTIPVNNLSVTASNVSLTLNSVSGVSYTLEYKTALNDAAWLPLLPPTLGTGRTMTLLDTNPPSGPSRFYRLSCQ